MYKVIITVYAAILSILLIVNTVSAKPTGDMVCTVPETTTTETETEYLPPITKPETTVAILETTVEAVTTALEPPPTTTPIYNVNLSTEVQECIITECGKYNIPPEIVVAMIERESRFNANAIGDNGNSFGLMQIQPRWHNKRMEKLGCADLLNPVQNVKVGIDYLGELYNRYGDIGKALTAYNTGSYNGTITHYAVAVMARANEV